MRISRSFWFLGGSAVLLVLSLFVATSLITIPVVNAGADPAPQSVTTVTDVVTGTVQIEVTKVMSDSLHGTTRGMEYFYSKAQGGMETLTGVPYDELPCKDCHTRYNKGDHAGELRCEGCHIADPEKFAPVQASVNLPQYAESGPQGCLSCHRRQGFEVTRTTVRLDADGKPVQDPVTGVDIQVPAITDVHRSAAPAGKGMQCVNCHDTGDTHGDGKMYNSLLESPNTKCTDCHQVEKLSQNQGHLIHGQNMTCASCHVQTVVSCYSCHINAVMKGAPEFPNTRAYGWKFLVKNDEGKIDVANLMAAVYTDDKGTPKTFAVIAPYFGHSVASLKGDPNKVCAQCHNNANVQAYEKDGKIVLSQWDAANNKVVFPAQKAVVVPVPKDYDKAFQLVFPVITNLEEVGKAGANAEKTAKWALGKETVDLWQMLYAKPLDKMPSQMDFKLPTPTPVPTAKP